jgi:hypothetical protein
METFVRILITFTALLCLFISLYVGVRKEKYTEAIFWVLVGIFNILMYIAQL